MELLSATTMPGGWVKFVTDQGPFLLELSTGSVTQGLFCAGESPHEPRRTLTASERKDLVGLLYDEEARVPAAVNAFLNAPRKPFKYRNNHWWADQDDKRIVVHGPTELNITIDFDDVDHDAVEEQTRTLIDILAANRLRP